MSDTPVETLIQLAETARDSSQLSTARLHAEQALAALPPSDSLRRRRAGLLLMHLCYRMGALSEVVALSADVLPLLRASGPTTELIDELRRTALCAADTGQYALSLRHAQECQQLSLDIDDPARLSLATNALACFFERTGDPWQAERLMLEALAQARDQLDPYPAFAALNNLSAALIGKYYLLRDALPTGQALEPLHRAWPHAEEAVALSRQREENFHKVFTLGNLGEILVHLGQADRAAGHLDEAMALARAGGFEAQLWRLGCSQGELQLLRNQPEAAWDRLLAVLHDMEQADQPTTRMRLHHALWRAAVKLSRPAAALEHLQTYLRMERQRSVQQLQAQSELFVTRMEAEQVRQEAQRHRARATALEVDVRRDQLTGLGNRREMEARWPEMIRQARTSDGAHSVAMLDLDHFKRVNDHHGHAVGDQVLVALADLLRTHTRGADLVARMGGEEFLLVLPDTGAERAHEVCSRLCQRVAQHPWDTLAPGLAVTLSIGLTSAPPFDALKLTQRADAALYRAKAEGRNRVVQL